MALTLEKKVNIVGYVMAGYAALAILGNYAIGDLRLLDFLFFLFFLGQSVGVILRREWARKALVAGGAVAVFYGVTVLLFSGFDREIGTQFVLYGGAVLAYYSRPEVRALFSSPSGKPQCCVLLIDDDRSFAKMIMTRLSKHGIMVSHAETGEKGLRMAREWKPDVILLDVILPGIKGREVCMQLKANDKVKHIPVIFLTAKDSQDDILAEMEAGAALHLTKPVDVDVLHAHIQNALQHAT